MTYNPRPLRMLLGLAIDSIQKCTKDPCLTLLAQIGFTGSTTVGKEILAEASSTMKSTSLECGGNNPLIICADADIDEVCSLTICYQRAAMNVQE